MTNLSCGLQNSMSKTFTPAKSTVDANAILLRLAGKPVGKKGETGTEDTKKSKTGKTKRANSIAHSGKNGADSTAATMKTSPATAKYTPAPMKTSGRQGSITGTSKNCEEIHGDKGHYDETDDWDNEMDESTLATFRDLFNTLDQSNTGIITADNLYEELRRVDSEITYSEVEDVLRNVDKDGDGTIDFDEFLYHMTNMGGDLFGDGEVGDEEKKKKNLRRQRMLYSAITQFSIKQTLADIEKTFRKQAPHVISHYAAGVRLIGLTTRQLERQMKKMQKSAAKNDSPYAKPLQFVHMGEKKIVRKEKIQPRMDKVASTREITVKTQTPEEADPAVANLSKEITDTMMMFTEQKGNMVPRLHDANILMQLRQKLGTVTAKMKNAVAEDTKPSSETKGTLSPVDLLNRPRSSLDPARSSVSQCRSRKKKTKEEIAKDIRKQQLMGLGWTTPRIQYIDVPLPSLKMKLKAEKPTFNDLHRIRAKAKEAIDAYYHDLRQTEIRNAWDHWDRLYADVILPKKLLENFRVVYGAYSPHREEEAFVVCPWKPGPFSYIRHMDKPATFSLPNSPDFRLAGATRIARKGNNVITRSVRSLPNSPTFNRSPLVFYNADNHSPMGRPTSSLAETRT